ncbi:MAG: ATP-binding protein [Nannocystaceae bacterium]
MPNDSPNDARATSPEHTTQFAVEDEGKSLVLGPEELLQLIEQGKVSLDAPTSLAGSKRQAPLRRWVRELVFTADEENRATGLSEAPYRSLFEVAFDDAPIGIVLSDLSGRIVRSNRAAADFLGRSADDLAGRAVGELSLVDAREEEVTLGNELIAGKIKSFQVEKQFVHSSGAILDAIVGLSILRSTESRPARVIAHITDIKEQKQLEKTAAEADKLRAISDFAGSLAHDLNNLLTSIISNTMLAREAPEEVTESLAGIDVAVATAERLVGQLQSLHSTAGIESQPLSIDAAIKENTPILTSLLPTTATLNTSLSCDESLILLNPSQFEQVLVNLVVNAGHALIDGLGTVKIRTRKILSVGTSDQRRESALVLEIEDTGEGMSEATLERIFVPFFSTRKHAGGTGLGLATVATIVSQSGGSLTVASTLGEGSTFKLQWPIYDPNRQPVHPLDVSRDQLHGLRILVIDDQPDILRIIRRLLTREKCEVTTATSLAHAKERLDTKGPFDIILSDVVLGDGDGTQLYLRAREQGITAPFVFMSGFGDSSIANAIGTSSYSFLRKPFAPADVRTTLLKALKTT